MFKLNRISNFFILAVVLILSSIANGSDHSWYHNNKILEFQVSFTSDPADDDNDGQITICGGTVVTFTDSSTDVPNDAEYEWNFEGGDPDFSEDVGPHQVLFDSEGAYDVKLEIDGSFFTMTVNVVSDEIEPNIEPTAGNWGESVFNGIDYFTSCGNQGTFSFFTSSTGTSENSQHTLILSSEGTEPQTLEFTAENNNGLFFNLPTGVSQIDYTIQQGSCLYEETFYFFVGAPPTASIGNDGSTVLCTSDSIEFDISFSGQNSSDTTYTIQVSDGDETQAVIFSHPPPATYTHTFSTVSCGAEDVEFNNNTYINAFEISITAANACGETSAGLAPLYVQSGPEADFTFNPSIPNNIICEDSSLTVIDSTIPGSNINTNQGASQGECDQGYNRFWQIAVPDGSTLNSDSSGVLDENLFLTVVGNMGFVPGGISLNVGSANYWSETATPELEITFLQPGNYELTLFTGSSGQTNSCGITSHTETICVTPEVVADFELNTQLVCSPAAVNVTNNSTQTACENQNIYDWVVTSQNPENCPVSNTPDWEFSNNTNSTSFEPEFIFYTPGVYEVSLTVSLGVDIEGTSCDPDTMTQTITVKETPQTTLPILELCENDNYTFDLNVFDCYADEAATFEWDFQASSSLDIDDSSILNPTISFSEAGTYPFTLTLSNECGDNVLSGSVEVFPEVVVTASAPNASCLNSDILLNGTISGGTSSGIWTASVNGGSFSPTSNDLVTSYTPAVDFEGSITFTLTSDNPLGPCPAESASVTVQIQPEALVDAGDYDPFCTDTAIQLAGSIGGAASSATWSSDVSGDFSNINNLNATFTTSDPGFTGVITFTLTTDDPVGACESVTDEAIVTVIPEGQVSPIPNYTYCHLDSTQPIIFVSIEPGTVFNWVNNDPSIGLVSSGQGNIPSFTATNTSPPAVATITVTPTITSGSTSCSGPIQTFTITVNPQPSIDSQPIAEQTVCLDGTVADLTVTYLDGVGAPEYQWYQSTECTADPNNATLLTAETTSSYTPATDQLGVLYYFVALTFPEGGCGTIVSECAMVEIKPVAVIPDVVVQICDETSYQLSPIDGLDPDATAIVPTATTYTWTILISNPNITGASEVAFPDNENQFDSGVLDNTNFSALETIVFEVTPWTDGCDGDPFEVSITVSPKPEINEVITNISCSYTLPLCGASIETNPIGLGPFTYNWTPINPIDNTLTNPTDKDQFDLCPGSYELSITDSSGCSYSYEYEIVPPEPIEFTAITTDVSCNNIDQLPCDGSIQVSPSGGILPYSLIQWTRYNPATEDFEDYPNTTPLTPFELINLCAGDYILKILDANGCEFLSPVYTIEEGVSPIEISETLSDYNGYNIDCFSANTGSITIDISGGSGIFTYEFTGDGPPITGDIDLQQDPDSSPLIFDNLIAGNYTLIISDSSCPQGITRSYNLTEPDELIISAQLVTPALCFGETSCYEVTASGGIPPYTGTGLQCVLGGAVTFIVSDSNGCQDDFSTVTNDPEELLSTFVVNDAPCFDDLGSITVLPTGGTGVLTVSLFDFNDNFIPPSINTTDGVSVTFNQPEGNYFYRIEDENNCLQGPISVSVSEPDPIVVDVVVTQPDCNTVPAWNFNNGSICVTITGGTNPFPLGDGWLDNGAGQWCLEGLTQGTYPIDITDDNGCLPINQILDVILTRPPEITAFFDDSLTIDCDTNTATQINTIIVNGGVPPYVITWSGPEFTVIPPDVMETSVPGNYSAFVNDQYGIANGCPPIEFPLDPITFLEFGIADFTLSSENSDFCGVYAVSDPVIFSNISTGDIVSFEWNFGDGSPTVANQDNPTHIYDVIGTYDITLTVTDAYGCEDIFTETIEMTQGYEIILPNAFTPNGDGINETIRPVYNCMVEVKMSIYDTWGSLIYAETGDDIYGWDGTIDGNPAENGNYIMVVSAEAFNGAIIDLNGPVTLIK